MRSGVSSFEMAVYVVGFLISALVGYFLFSFAYHYSDNVGRSLAAVYGRAGVEGTFTVTGERRSGGRTTVRQCVGTFTSAEGRHVRTGVGVHFSGDCEIGHTEEARLVVGRDSWLQSVGDSAYAESAGPGGLIFRLLFVDLFCGIVGLACAIFAWVFGRELFKNLRRLVVAGRRPSS